MFSQTEIERILKDKTLPRRFINFNKQISKGGAGTELDQAKEYVG